MNTAENMKTRVSIELNIEQPTSYRDKMKFYEHICTSITCSQDWALSSIPEVTFFKNIKLLLLSLCWWSIKTRLVLSINICTQLDFIISPFKSKKGFTYWMSYLYAVREQWNTEIRQRQQMKHSNYFRFFFVSKTIKIARKYNFF